MKLGVVVPCYRQERFLPRCLAAIAEALREHPWSGALVLAAPSVEPFPALSPKWRLLSPPVHQPLTPGAARMLGVAAVEGDWVLFVDGDVEVDPAWVLLALKLAAARSAAGPESQLAGMGGRIEEWIWDGAIGHRGSRDLNRVGSHEHPVDHLTTPVLYRRSALLEVGGYDPRLNSEEDFELGLRFAARGYELRSLGTCAGSHWSGPRPSLAELDRRWRSGLCFGQGQVLRLYLRRPEFTRLLRRQALYVATLIMWAIGLVTLAVAMLTGNFGPFLRWTWLFLGAIAFMSLRKRSVRLGAHSLLTWTANGLGMLVGFFQSPPGMDSRAGAGEAS